MKIVPPQLGDFVAHPRAHPTGLSYLNGFSYGLGINMLMLLVPLYIIDLGFSLSDLGLVVSSAAVFMILLRLAGGAVSDRFGERIVLWFSFGALAACALVFVVSETLLPLIVAQLLNGASRSVYWSAGQSYTSRSAEGDAGKTQGRLLSFESGGGILGALIGGAVVQLFGFDAAFLAAAAINGIGILATVVLPPLPRKDQFSSVRATIAPAVRLLVRRSMGLGHYSAFMSAGYAALTGTLFVALFKEVGYDDAMVGFLRSLMGVGVAVVAFPFGTLLAAWGTRNMAMAGLGLTGTIVILTALTGSTPAAAIALMMLGGLTFGSLRALYPAIAAANSRPQERGLAFSAVGLYWAVGMLIVPISFGVLGDAIGVRSALYIFGGISMGA
ncbi:MAG: MFS transporter, partial [Dehalococcoidia bacterium]